MATVWVLEANPNPQIARGEDFAASAEKIGLSYETVLQRIINLGLRCSRRAWHRDRGWRLRAHPCLQLKVVDRP